MRMSTSPSPVLAHRMVLSKLCTVASSTCVNFWRDLLRVSQWRAVPRLAEANPFSALFLAVEQRSPGIYQLAIAPSAVKGVGQHVQCHLQFDGKKHDSVATHEPVKRDDMLRQHPPSEDESRSGEASSVLVGFFSPKNEEEVVAQADQAGVCKL